MRDILPIEGEEATKEGPKVRALPARSGTAGFRLAAFRIIIQRVLSNRRTLERDVQLLLLFLGKAYTKSVDESSYGLRHRLPSQCRVAAKAFPLAWR